MVYKVGDKILYSKLTGEITRINFPFIEIKWDKTDDPTPNRVLNINQYEVCDNLRKLTKLDKALK